MSAGHVSGIRRAVNRGDDFVYVAATCGSPAGRLNGYACIYMEMKAA